MKVLLYSILLTTLSFCSASKKKDTVIDYSGFLEKKIVIAGLDDSLEQKDTLAFLTLKIPQRLDTFYRWNDHSCCTSCGYLKYRFADNHYPQVAETGWFPTGPDSNYQLTIWHRPTRSIFDTCDLKPLTKNSLAENSAYLKFMTSSTIVDSSYRRRELIFINNRPFVVSFFWSRWSSQTSKPALFAAAITNFRSRQLSFIAECSAKDTTGFIENMYKSILSIKIDER